MASLREFIARRRERWVELEQLLARVEGSGLRTLRPAELDLLGRRYRQVVSDLAVAQRDFPQDQVTSALNQLAARAHLRLYRAPAGSWSRVRHFFSGGFARRFRQAGGYVAVAAALFFLPLAWAYVAALLESTWRGALVPPALLGVMERGRTWTDIEAAMRPGMAAVIFTNNIQVSFLAFAGGVLFGLGTAYVLVTNGLLIGGVFGAAHHFGVAPLLWAFVSAHGYLEITSILIAGAAGLMLGKALLLPGFQRRRDALARAAHGAISLVGGAMPVFVLAGLVEGFVSPGELLPEVKYAIGPLLGLGLWAFLLTAGKAPSAAPKPPSFPVRPLGTAGGPSGT